MAIYKAVGKLGDIMPKHHKTTIAKNVEKFH